MEDPFVKRMMERTKARNKILGLEKKNYHLGGNFSEERILQNESNIVHQNINENDSCTIYNKPNHVASPSKPTSCAPKNVIHSSQRSPKHIISSQSTGKVNVPILDSTTSSERRFNKLAQVTQRLQEWEDDYNYHSVCGGAPVEVENVALNMHADKNVLDKAAKPKVESRLVKPIQSSPIKDSSVSSPKSKYYYGEPSLLTNTEENERHLTKKLSIPHLNLSPSNQSYHSAKSYISSPSSQSFRSSISSNLPLRARDATQNQSKLQPNSASPTRQLAWDKQLISSLDAQGFTPSDSRSRLSYDFERDRSPLKENANNFERKIDSLDNQPPKIVSYLAKSPGSSPQKKRQNRASSPAQNKSRDQSPSKVSDLRSRWEQHIRDSSPERLQENLNPNKNIKHCSPTKNESPTKITELTRPASHSKIFPPKIPVNSEAPLKIGFQKEFDFQSRNKSTSPKKEIWTDPNVKIPVISESTTVLDNPTRPISSVKDKIAAFSSLRAPKIQKKDPTEMSVQDRKNIFENRKGGALIPKAPFAQNAPSKVLQNDIVRDPSTATVTKNDRFLKINKTYICEAAKQEVKQNSSSSSKSFDAPRNSLEFMEEKWRSTALNKKNIEEKKQDMNILLNRFHKSNQPIGNVIQNEDETESEYPQSDESSDEFEIQNCGPPKPPRAVEESLKLFVKTPQIKFDISPSKRMNSTELGEVNSPSPRKEYVPRVKPGCLFPSLSDIESHSEAVDSPEEDDLKESSFTESILTCTSIDSLGKQIQSIAKPVGSNANFSEGSNTAKDNGILAVGDSALEAIAEIDNALDEAFSDEDPTPPKRSRDGDYQISNSYKTPTVNRTTDTYSDSEESSLAHSISMYRKQKPADVLYTPVRNFIRKPNVDSPSIESPISPSVDISSRIKALHEEEELQLTVISQASSAINVVAQHPEQHGTPQHVEAEKLILVATKKRQAALDEIQRLKAEGALGKRHHWIQGDDSSRGSISISNIALPLKQSFLKEAKDHAHHLLVLVKHRDQVITSQMQKTPESIVEGAVSFPNLMSLHNLSADFNISLEVYCFKVDNNHAAHHKKDFKKEHSRMILTPLKRLQKESRTSSPAVQSPASHISVRSTSFALVGFSNLNINTLTRNAWTLEKVPYASPLDGHLLMRVSVSMEGGVTERSFLTMFEDVGGFGAWNRRWCVLSGPFLRYWSYPDDETKKDCVGHLDLRMCTTRKVELVTRDICARQFTFELIIVRPATKHDKTNLVHEVRRNTVISRILLSADSKEERILWCNKLNNALANIRAWDPDALRPEDYHV